MNPRRLTVSYHTPLSRSRFPACRPARMPYLRLLGRWLDEAGFSIGSGVRVEVTQGRLVLEVILPEPPAVPAPKRRSRCRVTG